ncbi:hypothetical protein [Streptomyces gardneri]|uniref:hypothetical protein n=1 Tax=Streptomyces gardneri TaxID=66892 RepID=UPI0035DC7537
MTEDIIWREATKADTVRMQSFTCTNQRRQRGEIPYEREVQAFFRQRAIPETNCSIDARLDGRLMIAEDCHGIAAAYAHRLLARHEYPPKLEDLPPDQPIRELCFLGIALRHRGKGGAMAGEAINEALWDILDSAPEASRIYVTGLVDYRNKASERMLIRYDFEQVSEGGPPPTKDNPDRLGRWIRILRPADAANSN